MYFSGFCLIVLAFFLVCFNVATASYFDLVNGYQANHVYCTYTTRNMAVYVSKAGLEVYNQTLNFMVPAVFVVLFSVILMRSERFAPVRKLGVGLSAAFLLFYTPASIYAIVYNYQTPVTDDPIQMMASENANQALFWLRNFNSFYFATGFFVYLALSDPFRAEFIRHLPNRVKAMLNSPRKPN
jgi:hypothetical protein